MFVLTSTRAATLRALADTFIPAGPAPGGPPPGSALVDLDKLAAAILAQPLSAQADFGQLLDILDKPLAGLTWWGPLRPFRALTPAQRERLLAILWSEMTFVKLTAGTRTDHADALMDLLDELDVPGIDYDADGFDQRVKTVRQELKKVRRAAGQPD